MDGVLADLTMAAHFAFVLYVVVGGFIAWHWPMIIGAHVMAVVWCVLLVVFPWDCPLTLLENTLRRRAGEPDLGDEGFIATYLTGRVYPEEHLAVVQLGAAVLVMLSWVGFAALMSRHRRASAAVTGLTPTRPRPPSAP